MYDKVEAAMEGAGVGDLVEVMLTPEESFGEADTELIYTHNARNVPPEFRRVGAEVEFQNERRETKSFIVTSVSEKEITIDGSNPLAGKNLIFRVKIHAIRDASPVEIQSGMPA